MNLTFLPENNPFIKDNFSKEIESVNKHLADSHSSILKANQIKDSIVENLIEHAYSLIPNTEKYEDHYNFIRKIYKGKNKNNTVRKMLLEIFILDATHFMDTDSMYDNFYKERDTLWTRILIDDDETIDISRYKRHKMFKDLNRLLKDIGKFTWVTNESGSTTEISFELKGK